MNGTSKRNNSYEFTPDFSNYTPMSFNSAEFHSSTDPLLLQQQSASPVAPFYNHTNDNIQYLHDRSFIPLSVQTSATDYSILEDIDRIPVDDPIQTASESIGGQTTPDLANTPDNSVSSAGNFIKLDPSYLEDFVTSEPSFEESAHIDEYLNQYIKLELVDSPNDSNFTGLGIKRAPKFVQQPSTPKRASSLIFKEEEIPSATRKTVKPRPKAIKVPPKPAHKLKKTLSTTQMATAAAAAAISSRNVPERKYNSPSFSSAAAIATTTKARNPRNGSGSPVSTRKSLPSTPKKQTSSAVHSKDKSAKQFSFVFEAAPKMPTNNSSACSLSSSSTISSNYSINSSIPSSTSPTASAQQTPLSSKPTFIIYSQQQKFVSEPPPTFSQTHSRRNSIATPTSSVMTPLTSPLSASVSKFGVRPTTSSSSISSVSLTSSKYKKSAKPSQQKQLQDMAGDLKHNSEFQKSITKFPKNNVAPFEPKIYKDMKQGLMEFQLNVPPK
ncbi:hypothetical protein OGAPHI_002828 [Ogataea philodendri]|uniref:Uncharacterized protein n=1 Tax=Ogataea philodendri TaxID=1378263 RepID=A0A9P8P933_9ASCO|nr:uncharacterized protein OGAPHI_002828 [Ogataea philodendri]KAH3667179.1 hypothetical protein OGAPHI_002828 [Ogataea philodendri]